MAKSLSLIDICKSCLSHKFFLTLICLLMLFGKIKFLKISESTVSSLHIICFVGTSLLLFGNKKIINRELYNLVIYLSLGKYQILLFLYPWYQDIQCVKRAIVLTSGLGHGCIRACITPTKCSNAQHLVEY